MALSKINSKSLEDSTVLSADIADDSIVNADIKSDAAIATTKVTGAVTSITSHGLAASATTDTTNASNISTGTIPDARIQASGVTQHVQAVDLSSVKQDIAMLALYNAVSDNRAAYNLPNSFIDQFEDDTGLTTQTDVDRDSTGEYVSSVSVSVGVFTSDANTLLLLHSDTSHNSTTFTDSSSNSHTITAGGDVKHHSNANITEGAKFDGSSIYFDGSGDQLSFPDHASFDFGTADFTIEGWFSFRSNPAVNNIPILWGNAGWATNNIVIRTQASGPRWEYYVYGGGAHHVTRTIPQTAWHHYAVSRASGTLKMFYDGTEESYSQSTAGSENISGDAPRIGQNAWNAFTGYMDEYRVSNNARYSSAFTPNEITTVSATGTLISDTQTVPSAITKMSGVILLKDNGSSTTTLGTHLTISFSATNGSGSDWVNAASYTAVTAPFSTGVTMIKLGETTVPSGTSPTIRAVWASQTEGGYESQLHGWAMNY